MERGPTGEDSATMSLGVRVSSSITTITAAPAAVGVCCCLAVARCCLPACLESRLRRLTEWLPRLPPPAPCLLQEVAVAYGLSKERIRQIEDKAMRVSEWEGGRKEWCARTA